MKICLNGDLVDRDSVPAAILEEHRPLGSGVFETFLVRNGEVNRLSAHLNRLYQSAETWNLVPPITPKELQRQIKAFLSSSGFQGERLRGKILMTNDFWWFQTWELPAVSPDIYEKGVKVMGVQEMRVKPKAKSTSPVYKKHFQGEKSDFFETLFFDLNDNLLEGNITNVFVLMPSGTVVTPDSGMLLGITRQAVIEELKRSNIKVEERSISKSEMKTSQAIFLTNSIKGIVPVAHFEDWISDDFGLAQKLQTSLFKA